MKNNRNLRAFSLIEISIVVLIIGILIVGVTQSSRLVAQAKVNSARTLTQSSPAPSIDGLVFWIETSSPQESFSNEDIEDGDAITLWNDINSQNSTRNNLALANGAPVYTTNGINSIPALTFNSNSLTSSNFANISTGTVTVFAALRLPSALSAGTIVSKSTNFELKATADGKWQFCTSACNTSSASATANGSYVVSVVFNNDSTANSGDTLGGVNIFQNGVLLTQADTTSQNIASNATALTIGNVATGTADYLEGVLGEVIVFDRSLKQEERQSVEEYLGKKWGITVSKAAI